MWENSKLWVCDSYYGDLCGKLGTGFILTNFNSCISENGCDFISRNGNQVRSECFESEENCSKCAIVPFLRFFVLKVKLVLEFVLEIDVLASFVENVVRF